MTVADRQDGGALQRALRGFFLSAAAMDGGFFLILVAMPFKVLDLGGGALELGLVAALGAVSYIVGAPLSGRLSDRGGRTLLCLTGGLLLVAVAVLALLVQRLDLLIALQVLMGVGKALYWPSVQATLAELSPGAGRLRVLGRFNLAWSSGKTAGFILGGVLLGCCGFTVTYLAGAAAVVLAFVLLPRGHRVVQARLEAEATPAAGASSATDGSTSPARLRVFRNMGWVANTAAAGAFGILTHHLPQWFAAQGWDPDRDGWFLGSILGVQTVVFLLLGGRLGLMWSAWRLWLPQLAAAAAVAAVPWLPRFAALLAVAPLVGIGGGVCYAASIYYSLAGPERRGRYAGIHEGLIGAGGFLPPLAAGVLVRAGLGLSAPYLLAALLLLAALGAQFALHAGSRRDDEPTVS